MIRGITFQIPNKVGQYLREILNEIDLINSKCYVDFNEVYLCDEKRDYESLFVKEEYSGFEFSQTINEGEQLLIFLELFIYPKNSVIQKIVTYEDFQASNCEMILLVADSSYVTVYHKDVIVLKNLFERCHIAGYTDVTYVDENDARYKMSVM